ncbi:MAG: NTF2-like N-terminal transpeptidase domain-containing protein, partial [Clostridium sp.]
MKDKKLYIIIISVGIAIVLGVLGVYFMGKNDIKDKSVEATKKYFELLNSKEYKQMYELLTDESKKSISEEEFIKRNKNIYEGIEAKDIKVETKDILSEGGQVQVNTYTTMETQGGKVEFDNKFTLDGESYKVKWSSNLIFPELNNDYKVKVSTTKSKRGDILDRNDKKLATDSFIGEVGIVPEKVTTSIDNVISQVASVLNIPVDFVDSKVKADYVKPYMLVPIKKLSLSDERIGVLKQIGGVVINERDGRVYP